MKSKINVMVRLLLMAVLLMSVSFSASAAKKFTGKVDGKYPVVAYIYGYGDNLTGKYAYVSTLKKYGNKPSSWLYFSGDCYGCGAKCMCYECEVKDSNGKVVEKWLADVFPTVVNVTITTK